MTDTFEISTGLKQGCPLSTILFNLVLEWVMQQTPATPARSAIQLEDLVRDRLAYADDVDICGENLEDLEDTVTTFRETSIGVGLEINETKTKIMRVAREGAMVGDI